MPKHYRMIAEPPCANYTLPEVVTWRAVSGGRVLSAFDFAVTTEQRDAMVYVYPAEPQSASFSSAVTVERIEVRWGDMDGWLLSAEFPGGLTVPEGKTLNMFPDRHLLALHRRLFKREAA